MDEKRYRYNVFWSEKDQEYVGTCAEFPSLSWLDEDQREAFYGIQRLVLDVLSDMESNGEPIPEPIYNRKFSGKIALRTTPETHHDLVIHAAEHGVSLNRHINMLISK